MPIIKRVLKDSPEMVKAIENRHIMYNGQTAYIEEKEKKAKLLL